MKNRYFLNAERNDSTGAPALCKVTEYGEKITFLVTEKGKILDTITIPADQMDKHLLMWLTETDLIIRHAVRV